jgi:hypothetical protein
MLGGSILQWYVCQQSPDETLRSCTSTFDGLYKDKFWRVIAYQDIPSILLICKDAYLQRSLVVTNDFDISDLVGRRYSMLVAVERSSSMATYVR